MEAAPGLEMESVREMGRETVMVRGMEMEMVSATCCVSPASPHFDEVPALGDLFIQVWQLENEGHRCIKGCISSTSVLSTILLERRLANSCMTMLRYGQFPMILFSRY